MKKLTLIAAVLSLTSLTGCAEINKALEQAVAEQRHQQELRAKYGAPEGMDPEMLDYMDKSMTADRAANEDPNNVHGQAFWNNLAKRCGAAVAQGHNASLEILQAYNIVMPQSVWSAQEAVYIKACQGGFEAGEVNNQADYRQAYQRLKGADKRVKTKVQALQLANDIGVMSAYREGFKVSAGFYPNAR